MSRNPKILAYSPKKSPKAKITDRVKEDVTNQSRKLVETLREEHIKPPPEGVDFSYITEIYTKWFRNSFHFCARYCCRASNCITPSFETKFARIEYTGSDCFNLSYMRHTGKWCEMYFGLSLAECLESIRAEPHFMP